MGSPRRLSVPSRSRRGDYSARLGGPVAVRSSALDEDSEDASFAGQFETISNPDPITIASNLRMEDFMAYPTPG